MQKIKVNPSLFLTEKGTSLQFSTWWLGRKKITKAASTWIGQEGCIIQ
jgi:hypothetical protein